MRTPFVGRLSYLGESGPDGPSPAADAAPEQELLEHRLIRRAVIDAERRAVHALFQRGLIHDDILRRLERDLDLEELRMES